MAYSFYDGNVLMAKSALQSLEKIITAAQQHPNFSSFPTARLIDDMKPLTFQVYYATFQARCVAALLSGQTYVDPDAESQGSGQSYEEMLTRVRDAVAALGATDRDTVNKAAETMTADPRGEERPQVPVRGVVGLVYLPNIYFHVSMAYAILRKEGVPLGKRDWSRSFVADYV